MNRPFENFVLQPNTKLEGKKLFGKTKNKLHWICFLQRDKLEIFILLPLLRKCNNFQTTKISILEKDKLFYNAIPDLERNILSSNMFG